MRAIFLAVGSELLNKDMMDTNSLYITRRLREKGILVDMKVVVGDDLENLTWIVKKAYQRAQLVVITGGLGPTVDDITREAVSNAIKKQLIFREDIVNALKELFQKRGIRMPENNTRQAFIIEGAEIVNNPVGTAPGLYIEDEHCRLLLLPGPPNEMIPMFEQALEKWIAPLSNFHIYTRSLKFAGITESKTDSLIADIYTRYRNPITTILASPGIIDVHLLGRSKKSPEEAKTATDELAEKIIEKLKDYFFSEEDISIEEFIIKEMTKKKLTLSVAESCTGGALGNRVTNVPGSSSVYLGGVVAYSNNLKIKLVGVSQKTLTRHGAVSVEVAKEMAEGIRKATGSSLGLSITGIAGPGGKTPKKPVGMVYMHLDAEDYSNGAYKIFPGDRKIVKLRSVNYALNLILQYLRR